MTIQGIKTNVQAILTDTDYFVSVLPHPPNDDVGFDGYPSVAHYYEGTQSDYATVSENRRVITYRLDVVLVANPDTPEATLFSEMYDLMDNVIQVFDESVDLSDATLSLTPACDILRPVPGGLQKVTSDQGTGLLAEINLLCEQDVSFR